jgi:hypothetical protein
VLVIVVDRCLEGVSGELSTLYTLDSDNMIIFQQHLYNFIRALYGLLHDVAPRMGFRCLHERRGER